MDPHTSTVGVVRGPEQAASMLHPIRRRILETLREPGSASSLAPRLGLPRQKVNYHLRALERQGVKTPVVVCSGLVEDEASFPIPGVRTAPKSAGLREIRAAVEQALGPPSAAPTSSRTRSDRR